MAMAGALFSLVMVSESIGARGADAAAAVAAPAAKPTPAPAQAEAEVINYDEAKVPAYVLPETLACADGTKVTTSEQWKTVRRPEVLKLFREQVYGFSPGRPRGESFQEVSVDANALGGKAVRKQISIRLTGDMSGPRIDVLIYLPAKAGKAVPAFLGLNFLGNAAVHPDPGILLNTTWFVNDRNRLYLNNRPTEKTRGIDQAHWQVEQVLARGYAFVTAYYGDIEPDHAEGWREGVRSVFPAGPSDEAVPSVRPIETFAPNAWGAIGAWAWGLSRIMDYLETDPGIDARQVALMGHSRLGKTALWAGAQDERFAVVISNNSGEGGAAIARRKFGESTAHLNRAFPPWFNGNFKQYSGHEEQLPVDQHELIALIAPRPVYVASAEKDQWADPNGEFLAAKAAGPVYALFGRKGVGVDIQPPIDKPEGDFVGYHIRTGEHEVNVFDWTQYLRFADRHFGRGSK